MPPRSSDWPARRATRSTPRSAADAGPGLAVVFPFTPFHRGGSGEPLVLLHGIADSWRTWQLVLPELERSFDVLAPTLPGHAGGPPIEGPVDESLFVDFVAQAMDDAGFGTAHVAGNSLGGYLALKLAER